MAMTEQALREERVTFQGPSGRIGATLTIPAASPARGAVLILAGSGPLDRDGNTKRMKLGVYWELAHAVGRQGFLSLRYDKPGVGESEGDPSAVGFWDLVADAEAAAQFLRDRSGEPPLPLIVIGHSEGTVIGPVLHSREPLQGLVTLAGPCESLSTTLARQQDRAADDLAAMKGFGGVIVRALNLPERSRRQSRAAMAKIFASDSPTIRISGVKINARWIREQCSYDVTKDLPKVDCPVLAITGSKDIQVLPEHARAIAEAVSGPAEWHILEDMTHLMRRTAEPVSMVTLKKLYQKQSAEPIDGELPEILGKWLDVHFPVRDQRSSEVK